MWTIHSEIINQGEWPMQTCMIVEMGQWVSVEVTLSHKIYQCQRLRQAYATRDTFYQVLCGGYSGSSYCYVTLTLVTERFASPGLMLHSVLSVENDRPCMFYHLVPLPGWLGVQHQLPTYYYMKESIYWSLKCVLLWVWVCVVDSCLVCSLVSHLIPVEVVWSEA